MLFSAINLIISCPNFSITYQYLTYLWGVISNEGYLSEGHTQGILRFYHPDVTLRPIPCCLVPSTWCPVQISALHMNFWHIYGCYRQWRVLEWRPHTRDYKTLALRCKSETHSILFSAINLISCPNFSITYQFLTYLWGIIGSWGYLSKGHTQGITRL